MLAAVVAEHMDQAVVELLLVVAELAVKDVAVLDLKEQVQMVQITQAEAVEALDQDMVVLVLVELVALESLS
tara:strand:+ start:744 stop:959 length:216 start_codon:yes stop_codon:yes gene_type:complete